MIKIQGDIRLPGDKSISHRAAMLSALRPAESRFTNFNFNNDCRATLDILRALGIESQKEDDGLIIRGKSLSEWEQPQSTLDAKNSGTTARLMSGLLMHLPFSTTLTGDESLQKRPMKRIIDPLTQMGARIVSNNGYLPMTFQPANGAKGIRYPLPVASAQVKSAVLLSGLFADGETEVVERVASRDHTERLLRLKSRVNPDGSRSIFSSPEVEVPDISMAIPGDFSSAAFFITAALITPGSELAVRDVSLNPTRTGFLEVLRRMGATPQLIKKQLDPEPMGDIFIRFQELRNIDVPAELVPNIIDEIPILAVLATQAQGLFRITNAGELRHKESDRIAAIVQNLKNVGAQVKEFEDGFEIKGPQILRGGKVVTFGDHRIAMAFAVAGLVSREPIEIDDPDCVSVSFPTFWELFHSIVQS